MNLRPPAPALTDGQTRAAATAPCCAQSSCARPCIQEGRACTCMPDIEPAPEGSRLSRSERALLIAIVLISAGIAVSLAVQLWLWWSA